MSNNTTLDDICAVIGYTPTRQLAAWFAGRRVYIPTSVRPGHPLSALLGVSVLRRLVKEWGGHHIRPPTLNEDQRMIRNRAIAEALVAGETDEALAARYCLTTERIGQIRRSLTDTGLIHCESLAKSGEDF